MVEQEIAGKGHYVFEQLTALLIGLLVAAAVWWWNGAPNASRFSPKSGDPRERESGRKESHGPTIDEIPLILDLTAAMLGAGLSLTESLRALAVSVRSCQDLSRVSRSLELGMSWDDAWATAPDNFAPLESALAFSRLAGASSSSLLVDSAQAFRRQAHRHFEKKAAELGVKLIVPLGLCALPAFLLLGVGPLVLSLLPQ